MITPVLMLALVQATGADAAPRNDPARGIEIEQRLGAAVPLDLAFVDSDGESVRLGDVVDERPVVLSLVYYECPMLCGIVLNELVKSLRAMELELGEDFDALSVSIDPDETPELAAANKEGYLTRYGRGDRGDAWHFLVGDAEPVAQLADAVGFRYRYDPETDQYAHAAGLFVLTPDGRISRVLYGVEVAPRDLRLALVEASDGRIGDLVDAVTLLCMHYDPTTGKYGFAIMTVIRILGGATVLAIGVYLVRALRRERRPEPAVS